MDIMIAAAGYDCRGCKLWATDSQDVPVMADPKTWQSILTGPNFGKFMGENQFKEYRKMIAMIWENDEVKDTDPRWEFSSAVEEFNQQWQNLVQPSIWMMEDESMPAWYPRKTKTGGLPNISFIMRKPEPLGTVSPVNCVFFVLTLFY